jgi:hypothetical protein
MQLVLLEGSQFINNWSGFSQTDRRGPLLPSIRAGTALPASIKKSRSGINQVTSVNFFAGLDLAANGGFIAAGENHYSIHDNVGDNMGYCQSFSISPCPTSNPVVQMTTNYGITRASQTQHDVSFSHNTMVYVPSATASAVISLANPTIASGIQRNLQ